MDGGLILPPGLRQRGKKPSGQLELRRDHPLARGLVACVVFGGPYNLGRDLVTGRAFAPVNTPTTQAVRDGIGLSVSSTAHVSGAHHPEWNVLGAITVAWRGLSRNVGGGGALIGKIPTGGNGSINTPFSLEQDNPSAGRVSFVRSNLLYRVWQSDNTALSSNRLATVSVGQGADISVAPTFYLDGAPSTATSQYFGFGAGAPTGNSDPLILGRRPDGEYQHNGVTMIALVAARQWSVGEHLLFAADAYGLFDVPEERLFFAVRGASAPITADLAATLADATLSATATTTIQANADITLADATLSATAQVDEPEPDTAARGGDDAPARREDIDRLARRRKRQEAEQAARTARLRATIERAYRAATGEVVAEAETAIAEAVQIAPPAMRERIADAVPMLGTAQALAELRAILASMQTRRDMLAREDDEMAFILSVL